MQQQFLMSRIQGFPPIAGPQARILILGSMPSEASLKAQEYYAHPRNQFWSLMAELLGFDKSASYAERTAALEQSGIAVWDVLKSCVRKGSLDSDIDPKSLAVNDFREFFAEHRAIRKVYFNGTAAEQIFRKRVLPDLHSLQIEFMRLPSSSPANAGYSYARKLALWSRLADM